MVSVPFVLAACHVDCREEKAEPTVLIKMKTLAQEPGYLLEFEIKKKVRWSLSKTGTEEIFPLSFISASLCLPALWFYL